MSLGYHKKASTFFFFFKQLYSNIVTKMIFESEMLNDFFFFFFFQMFGFGPTLEDFVGSFSRITNSGFQLEGRFTAQPHELLCQPHESSLNSLNSGV